MGESLSILDHYLSVLRTAVSTSSLHKKVIAERASISPEQPEQHGRSGLGAIGAYNATARRCHIVGRAAFASGQNAPRCVRPRGDRAPRAVVSTGMHHPLRPWSGVRNQLLFHVPNGESRSGVSAGILTGCTIEDRLRDDQSRHLMPRGLGVVPGVVDLVLMTAAGPQPAGMQAAGRQRTPELLPSAIPVPRRRDGLLPPGHP